MTVQNVVLSSAGALSLTPAAGDVFNIEYDLHDYLGADVAVDVKLSLTLGESVPSPSNTVVSLTWRDDVTGDLIYQVDGVVGLDEENSISLANRAQATQAFRSFDVTTLSTGFAVAAADFEGYNPPNTLARNVGSVILPGDQPPVFDAEQAFDAVTLMQPVPSYIVLPATDDVPLWNLSMRAMDALNIPLDAEIDPTLTVDQAVSLAGGLGANDHRVALYWNPNVSRPRDAVSLRGAKKPRRVLGWLLGTKLLRNARVNAIGIPPIADPVAGERFQVPFTAMEQAQGVVMSAGNLEKLAVAKINVVRQINYDTGARFVVSDVLTQYASANSALRLTNAAEIICYTTNVVLSILRRHMLKRMTGYLTDASRDIDRFLSACSDAQSGLLQPAEDLGGQPYTFSLVPDEQFPFERVRLEMQRRPEGAVRSVDFAEDVVVK
jgi:hypothetical protein